MRLLLVNPNTSDAMTATMARQARAHAAAGTEIVPVTAAFGVPAIEGWADAQIAGHAVLDAVREHAGAVDGAIVSAYGEPGLWAAREQLAAPVLGIAQASLLTACALAGRFAVVTISARLRPMVEAVVDGHGLRGRCVGVRAIERSVADAVSDPAATERELAVEAAAAVARDGAEVVVLGGGVMGAFHAAIQARVDVPVVEGVACAVTMAQALVELARASATDRKAER